jgi:hypothetical protein
METSLSHALLVYSVFVYNRGLEGSTYEPGARINFEISEVMRQSSNSYVNFTI